MERLRKLFVNDGTNKQKNETSDLKLEYVKDEDYKNSNIDSVQLEFNKVKEITLPSNAAEKKKLVLVRKDGQKENINFIPTAPEKNKCVWCKVVTVPSCLAIAAYIIYQWNNHKPGYHGRPKMFYRSIYFSSATLALWTAAVILFDLESPFRGKKREGNNIKWV